jgi:hypothetical protein
MSIRAVVGLARRIEAIWQFTKKVWMESDLDVAGDVAVGGNATVTGNLTITGALDPAGGTVPSASSVTAAKLADAVADALVVATIVSLGAEAAHKRLLTIQMKDLQGNNLAVATKFWLCRISAADASYVVSDEGAGSITYDDTVVDRTLCVTDATGLAQIGITDTAAETVTVAIGSGPGTPFMQGVVQACIFAG